MNYGEPRIHMNLSKLKYQNFQKEHKERQQNVNI